MDRKQHTIKKEFTYTGIGLHTGKNVTINCKPLGVNQGIRFRRIDLEGCPEIKAGIDNVVSTQRCTTIGKSSWDVNTIEHLMSALNALKIDNLLIEIDANELPVTDGSAKIFYELIKEAGVQKQKEDKEVYKIDQAIYVKEGDQALIVLPDDNLKISYTFVSNHPSLQDQFAEFIIDENTYYNEIAAARTFGFSHEIERLKESGLALGGSLDNAILVGEDGPINELRFNNEFARHKILDILGDIKLAPEFKGHIIGIRSGHRLNSILSRKLKERLLK
ncbi:UDP-3-O-[3-hydroxymyristoyl] N-acetylglucosamine deacetylase [Orenia metallireducens]|uniref:UDP-3-O-acyl-N-acetylglucosamine deacetylase n=1 Tax=Orenia metallireducens TaxID=1413210 RepID=A0A285GL81_9FIRM|nr:UDP-3-O-acyl-N-acetylglucosamine deacetylase [Orenia metallireducens]SNY24322.1 UDP-3-O-[3-hydroxymyristoyl] N-acetylglucosamine deacetylase [Orenia metallireducens]